MQAIQLQHIEKVILEKQLLNIPSLTVNAGEKIGIIGENGAGKSTLIRIIAQDDQNYSGRVKSKGTIAYVPQMQEASCQSGGEQSWECIINALQSEPDILLLDEPTSNLDVQHLKQLEQFLKQFNGTLLMISHDRQLLQETVQRIWKVEQGQITDYHGTYHEFIEWEAQKRKNQQNQYQTYVKTKRRLEQEAQKRLERAQTFKRKKRTVSMSDYKVNSRVGKYDGHEKSLAKTGKALIERVNRLEKVEKPVDNSRYVFKKLGCLSETHQTLLHLEENVVKQGAKRLFKFHDFKIEFGQKIAITGPNQSGKTTFLKAVLNHDLKGYYSPGLSIGYFSQNLDILRPTSTVFDNVMKESLQEEILVRNLLANLGFDYHKVDQTVDSLSGGERVRVSLAKVLLGNHNLLLLDEPSNFLDISTLESVEVFLQEYPGAVVLVSHDRDFVEHTMIDHFMIDEGVLKSQAYQQTYQNKAQQEVSLLKFRLNQLMMDPEASLQEIKQLRHNIDQLETQD